MAGMMPPQGAPQQGSPQGAPQGQEMSGPAQMIQKVGEGLMMITELLGQAGAPPEAAQKMAQITQEYQAVIESVMGGGGQQPPSGAVSPEQGAGQAQPMNPAMRG